MNGGVYDLIEAYQLVTWVVSKTEGSPNYQLIFLKQSHARIYQQIIAKFRLE